MKTKIYKLSTVLIIVVINLLFSSSVFAQALEKFSYQAVIRDANNNLLANQTIGMNVSILVGYPPGSTVFIETHTPTTNANGLVSIEIGGGTPVHNTISNIGWVHQWYHIKTEVDPTGGTNYTITAINQILCVPYAIYAQTAEKADSAEVAEVALNVVEYTAGDGIDISNAVVSNTAISTTYEVGDFAQGGIVFWVDETGEHGLVCAIEDQSSLGTHWSSSNNWTYADGEGPFSGEMNTLIMIASADGPSAALRCTGYASPALEDKIYGDWYLPSREELSIMCENKATINATAIANGGSAFINDVYWSSTESNANIYAKTMNFSSCSGHVAEKDEDHYVRAIRAF